MIAADFCNGWAGIACVDVGRDDFGNILVYVRSVAGPCNIDGPDPGSIKIFRYCVYPSLLNFQHSANHDLTFLVIWPPSTVHLNK